MRGVLEGHSGWVTSLATSLEKYVSPCRTSKSTLRLLLAQTCSYQAVVTSLSLFGTSHAMIRIMELLNEAYTVILISFLIAYVLNCHRGP